MCTKWFADGDVHAYFSPYQTPHEAHTSFMNALADLRLRLEERAYDTEERLSEAKRHGNSGAGGQLRRNSRAESERAFPLGKTMRTPAGVYASETL